MNTCFRHLLLWPFAWLLGLSAALAIEPNPPSCANTLDCAANSVVSLLPDWPSSFSRNQEPEGSGIIVDNGTLVATADHVLGPAKSARIRTRNGRILTAKIVWREPRTDIALLEIDTPYLPFKKSSGVSPGEDVCAVGNSFGLDISITCGVVSATHVSGVGFNSIEDFIQTDAAVNPGMSGGALIDRQGNLVGMLSAIYTKGSDGNLGVNFSVSTDLLFTIIEDFKDDGIVKIRKAGILAKASELPKTDGRIGLEIVRLFDHTPEQRAGLEVGDIILRAGERRITNPNAYSTAIAMLKNDQNIELLVWREGTEFIIKLEP